MITVRTVQREYLQSGNLVTINLGDSNKYLGVSKIKDLLFIIDTICRWEWKIREMFQRGEGVDGNWIGDEEQHLNYGERREERDAINNVEINQMLPEISQVVALAPTNSSPRPGVSQSLRVLTGVCLEFEISV